MVGKQVKHSLFELFKIGIGPSSSHTMGPMRAALRFARELESTGLTPKTASIQVDLYGSLALTGHGHGTDRAILLGLSGQTPEGIDPEEIEAKLTAIRAAKALELPGHHTIAFDEAKHLIFHRDQMYPVAGIVSHPNGMRFSAFDSGGALLLERIFYSIGGGFIVSEEELLAAQDPDPVDDEARGRSLPFSQCGTNFWRRQRPRTSPSRSLCWPTSVRCWYERPARRERRGSPRHSAHLASDAGVHAARHRVRGHPSWRSQGAAARGEACSPLACRGSNDPLSQLDWITVYAMAVNEENAAGGRVVTAPTNGAAGVVPAVAHYYLEFVDGANEEGILRYFLTAAAIGILYKENASISGAEVGCQGEVGVACSMAAGGLVSAINGPQETTLTAAEINDRIEHAAEIGMEHHLGMTCDPIGGLVQVPCIERNAVGAIKAVNASRMAMNESEGHKVSLDQVIKTMYQTGLDMQARYKETSLAGLALNVIEC